MLIYDVNYLIPLSQIQYHLLFRKIKKIVEESLSGLNNEKIIQKLDKIRDCVARENGVIISSKSLAESLSHSIVKTQQMRLIRREKHNPRFRSIDSNNQLFSKFSGTNSNTMTNSLCTSIENNERLKLKEDLADNSKFNSRRRDCNSKAHKQSTFFNSAINSNIESICKE